jgi:hypothetical protein
VGAGAGHGQLRGGRGAGRSGGGRTRVTDAPTPRTAPTGPTRHGRTTPTARRPPELQSPSRGVRRRTRSDRPNRHRG